jgi:hypothetical protein
MGWLQATREEATTGDPYAQATGPSQLPIWQFKDNRVLDGVEEALKMLNASSRLDDLGRMLFFLSNRGFLGGKRPLAPARRALLMHHIPFTPP